MGNLGRHWKIKDTSKMNKDKIGKKRTDLINNQLAKGNKLTKEQIEKRTETRRKNGWWKNPEEEKKKIGKRIMRNRNPNWIDGRTKENNPYPEDWIDVLRDSIRKRDGYICQICGIHQDELSGWNRKLDIHHQDYNKDNLNIDNLIALCRSCHIKTNYNRDYWIKYFVKVAKTIN